MGVRGRVKFGLSVALVASMFAGIVLASGPTMRHIIDFSELGTSPLMGEVASVTYSLWTDEFAGEQVWEETHHGVQLGAEIRPVTLGASVPLPLDRPGELWLEVEVAGRLLGSRVPLGSSGVTVDGPVRGEFFYAGSDSELILFELVDRGFLTNFYGPLAFSAGEAGAAIVLMELVRTATNQGTVYLDSGSDASLGDSTGYMVWGDEDGANIVIDNNEIMARDNGTTSTLFLQQNGGAVFVNGSQVHASDATLKRDVRDLELGIDELRELRPVSFEWKSGQEERRHLGFIAQEIQEIAPDLVYEGEEGKLGLSYMELVPLLVKALQTQDAEIAELKSELEPLRARLTALELQARD